MKGVVQAMPLVVQIGFGTIPADANRPQCGEVLVLNLAGANSRRVMQGYFGSRRGKLLPAGRSKRLFQESGQSLHGTTSIWIPRVRVSDRSSRQGKHRGTI
jgi:hypothetical protein